MKQKISVALLAVMIIFSAAQTASAQRNDEEHEVVDARLEGYNRNVTLSGGTALTWILLIFLGGICAIGLFKDAKRTHLD